jgi:hypothetical protein
MAVTHDRRRAGAASTQNETLLAVAAFRRTHACAVAKESQRQHRFPLAQSPQNALSGDLIAVMSIAARALKERAGEAGVFQAGTRT